jgi:hypothetical protein
MGVWQWSVPVLQRQPIRRIKTSQNAAPGPYLFFKSIQKNNIFVHFKRFPRI